MIANAIFAATVVTLGALFFLAGKLRFLAPYRLLLLEHYLSPILIAITIFFLNLAALFFALGRLFFLKDTGSKLAHFDRELNAGRTPMPPHLRREELN
ncbi:MAG TPA: hypothetical protein VL156_13685 [Terriglobales bacterium]|jgi:hypothetical protein|nr:hypothetical protein [Terriglobales bacterium]